MTNSQLIFSVKEIFTDYLNSEYEYFNIPEYQRGYKWNVQQIEQLLNDINRFQSNGNDERFYCVQNITIIEKEKDNDKYYNVVDGQQRLTTLSVLLSYLGESNLVNEKIKYSVRQDTEDFINEIIIVNKILTNKWVDFLNSNPNKDYDHQDIFYLFTAHNTIKKWFDNNKIDKAIFKNKLLDKVKLIINKPDRNTEEQELFMNLNTGKVSLDGADLVRALLITNVAKEELENSDFDNTKSIVKINERRVRIGLELDEISAWWNQPNVREYFSFLNKISVPNEETIDFDSEQYPIDLLYKLFLTKDGKKEIRLQDFENKKYIGLYINLISFHRTIKDWYQNCEIYHFVKYILSQTDISFSMIWKDWIIVNSRQNFIAEMKDKSKKNIENFVSDIDNLDENWFDNEDSKLYKTLIITDIIRIIQSQESENKLPFLPADYFRPKKEDIEHIFPQTPIAEKNKNEEKDIDSYIELLNSLVKAHNEQNEEKISELTKPNDWQEKVDDLKQKINEVADELINRKSIGNLVLLNEKINRGYGNDFYTKKRIEIIKNPKGKFIRPHTLNPFIKGFLSKPSELEIWTNTDIKANAGFIKKQITEFFNL